MAGTVSPEGKDLCICTIGHAQAARHYLSLVRVADRLVVNVRPHGGSEEPTSSIVGDVHDDVGLYGPSEYRGLLLHTPWTR